MTAGAGQRGSGTRFVWVDIAKAVAILWIVLVHFFDTWAYKRYPYVASLDYLPRFFAQCAPDAALDTARCAAEAAFVGFAQLGFIAVGVFLVLSGFGLSYSLARAGADRVDWPKWYTHRLLRLFPLYWVAHLIYLVSPYVSRPEPIDYRLFLSLLGDRFYPADTVFFYINPAWWFIGLLLQLYLIFPLLLRLLQRLGAVRFLLLCLAFTVASRYALVYVFRAHTNYLNGAFFGARLFEFALGMAAASLYATRPQAMERFLASPRAALLGLAVLGIGITAYSSSALFLPLHPFAGSGLCLLMAPIAALAGRVRLAAAALSYLGRYSYGLYLIHEPYVVYLGERIRTLALGEFALLACVVLTVLALASILLERWVYRLTDRLQTAAASPKPTS